MHDARHTDPMTGDPDRYAAIHDSERRAAQQDGMRIAREHMAHQMTVDECIEVAEHNLDGKSPLDELAAVRDAQDEANRRDLRRLSPAEAARHYLHRKDHK